MKMNNKDASKQHNKRNNTNNPYYYYGFVNEFTHLEIQMDLYMSKIYSQLSLQAIEFYPNFCEQTRSLRQLTLAQVHKDTHLLGYILTGDRSIFVKEKRINVMKMYKCAQKVSQLWVPTESTRYGKIPILYKKYNSICTPIDPKNLCLG